MYPPSIHPQSVDALIAKRLPAYLTSLDQVRLNALHQALVNQQQAQHRLQQVLGAITPLDSFASALLEDALALVSDAYVDVHLARLHTVWLRILPAVVATLPPPVQLYSSDQSLLAAALHNFTETETQTGAYHEGTRLIDETGAAMAALKPEQFATLCRDLDIGGQYQDYLQTHFRPEDPDARKMLEDLLEEVQRANLEAAVRLAQAKGELDELSYRQLLPLICKPAVVPSEPAVLLPRQLYLLGKRVIGVLTLEVRGNASQSGPLQGVIVWIPGDSEGEVTRHASWEALYRALAERLRKPGYPAFFKRFIGQAEQMAFSSVLEGLLAKTGPLALDGRAQAFSGEVFSRLRQDQVDKLFTDAAVLAVSTDAEERLARSERLNGYLSAGLDLLNLAALFVPTLGVVMLGVAAVQLASEVYEGYEDWQIGDRKGALDHLFGVAEAVVVNTVLLAGGAAVGRALARSGVVDELVPIAGADGKLRLADPDLRGYRVEHSDDDAVGEVINNLTWRHVRTHEGSYALHEDPATGNWQVRHPQRSDAARVTVRDNGSGGWLHGLQSPQQWQGPELLRRLAAEFDGVPERTLCEVMQSTGFDEARLRRLHVEGAPAPARLRDAVARHRLHERQPLLDAAAFEAQLTAEQPKVDAHAQLLLRDFPNLTPRCAQALVDNANQAQREQLLSRARVPLALAEQARWALRDSRLDRACAGLSQAQAVNDDTQRLALGLINDLSPWLDGVRVELREAAVDGEVLAHQGDTAAADVRRVLRHASGYEAIDARGQPLPLATRRDSLIKALLLHMAPEQLQRLGMAEFDEAQLARLMVERAARQRERAARLIGLVPVGGGVRPPVRLGDGRLGYPLSGRTERQRRALQQAVWQIYPAFTDEEVSIYLTEQEQVGVDPWSHMHTLQGQLAPLEQSLKAWQDAAATKPLRAARKRVARQLLHGWRRQSLVMPSDLALLSIEGEAIEHLPTLPAAVRFDHVLGLELRGLALGEVPRDFLQHFGNLRHLDLSGNRLSELPAALQGNNALQVLNLADNRITLGPDSNHRLGALTGLRELNLNRNILVAPPNLAGLDQLRRVSLRATGLTEVPPSLPRLLALETADLRDNRITTLDEAYFSQPARNIQRVFLHDNPLDARSEARLSAFRQAAADRVGNVEHRAAAGHNRSAWLRAVPEDERLLRTLQWESLAEEPQGADFFRLLDDLRDTEEHQYLRQEMGARVWMVIQSMEQNTQLRERLFELAAHPTSCSDSVALSFSQLEVQAWVFQVTAGESGVQAEPSLLRLGRSLFRLDEVDRAASDYIASLDAEYTAYDEVEVRLAYRIGLARSLDLPGQPEHARYTHTAEVLAARGRVLTAERTPRLAVSLAQRDFWRSHLQQTYRERFDEAQAPLHARLQVLEEGAGSTRDAAYLEALGELAGAFDSATDTLIAELTQQAVARHWP